MNKQDQQFLAQKIRTQYMEKQTTELDALRELDNKVKRPANVFAYTFGSIGAIIMGGGMSLVMTDIGASIGAASLPLGIVIGILGLGLTIATYPLYKRLLSRRKAAFAQQIIRLSDGILKQ